MTDPELAAQLAKVDQEIGDAMLDDTGREWRVTWFPPDRPFARLVGTESQCRKAADRQSEWNPILESREPGTWEMEDL